MDRNFDMATSAANNAYDLSRTISASALAQSLPSKQPEQPHTLAMRDALSTAHQIASETHSILAGLSDRLFGCDAPTNTAAAQGLQAVPNGSAEEALHSARMLCAALNTLRAAASRLEARL